MITTTCKYIIMGQGHKELHNLRWNNVFGLVCKEDCRGDIRYHEIGYIVLLKTS